MMPTLRGCALLSVSVLLSGSVLGEPGGRTAVLGAVASSSQATAQNPKVLPGRTQTAPKPARTPQSTGTPASFLRRMVGEWDTGFMVTGGGRMEMGSSSGTSVTQPDPSTVAFTLSRSEHRMRQLFPGGPTIPDLVTHRESFTLSYDAASSKYLLTVDSSFGLSFKKLSLSRQANRLSGEESVEIGTRPAKVTAAIDLTAEGGHNWNVTAVLAEVAEAKEADDKKDVDVQIGMYSVNFSKKRAEKPKPPSP